MSSFLMKEAQCVCMNKLVKQAQRNETVTCNNKELIHWFIGSLNVVEGHYGISRRCAIVSNYSRILVIFSLCRHR